MPEAAQQMPSQRRRQNAPLGRTQKLVLNLLAINSPQSIRDLARAWPTLTDSSARSAVDRLGDRWLVEFADWCPFRDARRFKLTVRGREAADRFLDDEVHDGR